MTAVETITAAAFTVPCDAPESDGTFEWDATTIVIAEAAAGERAGLGYTYGPAWAVTGATCRMSSEKKKRNKGRLKRSGQPNRAARRAS